MKTIKEYRVFLFFVTLTIALLAMIFLKNGFVFAFNENTGLYLFSSLVQSNAALISIFGVFYIFRLQSLNSAIGEIYESLCNINIPVGNVAREFRHFSIEQMKKKIDSYKQENDVSIEFKKWYEYEKSVCDIKGLIKKPTVIIITLISIQIIFLILSSNIHNLGFFYELLCFIFITTFQIYILVLLGKTIFIMVK